MERRVAGSSAEAASFVVVAWPPSEAVEAPSSGLDGEHKSAEDSIVAVAEDMSSKAAEAEMSASEGTYYLRILLC